ncbi:MAG: CoA ester lyase [Burkholderiaceae bacterium]
MTSVKLTRSVLYTPGANPAVMTKALNGSADRLIFDLEDAVAPESKVQARAHVLDILAAAGDRRDHVVVRVNDLDSAWCDEDVCMAVQSGVPAILFPKISSVDHLERAQHLMAKQGAGRHVELWCMIETPVAILNLQAIAQHAGALGAPMTTWVLGTNDLVKDMKAAHTRTREPLMTALSLAVLTARAYGLTVLDGVHNDIKDMEAFVQSCRQGREMGFDGKTLIHPSQITPCHEVFSPSEDEVQFARQVIEAFELPDNQGKGVIKVQGQMVELLHAKIAAHTLAMDEAIQARATR